MAQQLTWLERLGSIDKGVELINQLGWNIKIGEINSLWYVQSGEKVIFSTDTYDAVESFLYGMALAYSILPHPIVENLREEFGIEDDE